MQKIIVYAFVLLLFAVSCNYKDSPIDPKNENEPAAKKCRLVKMIQGTNNGAVKEPHSTFITMPQVN